MDNAELALIDNALSFVSQENNAIFKKYEEILEKLTLILDDAKSCVSKFSQYWRGVRDVVRSVPGKAEERPEFYLFHQTVEENFGKWVKIKPTFFENLEKLKNLCIDLNASISECHNLAAHKQRLTTILDDEVIKNGMECIQISLSSMAISKLEFDVNDLVSTWKSTNMGSKIAELDAEIQTIISRNMNCSSS